MKPNPYLLAHNWLADHKTFSLFLSHGALHLTVLAALLAVCAAAGKKVYDSSVKNYVVMDLKTETLLADGRVDPRAPVDRFDCTLSADEASAGHTISVELRQDSDYVSRHNPHYLFTTLANRPLGRSRWHTRQVVETDSDGIHYAFRPQGNRIRGTYRADDYAALLRHPLTVSTNTLNNRESPYKVIYLRLDAGVDAGRVRDGRIVIDLTPADNPDATVITFEKAIPAPTEYGLNRIVYEGDDMRHALREGGVYIEAQDALGAFRAERFSFIFTILIGTLIGFAIDIVVTLIYKWRRLTRLADNAQKSQP